MERPEDAGPVEVEAPASTDESTEATAPRAEAPAPTTAVAPTEAASEEGWVYLDDTGAERGPFTLQEMLTWWNCSLLRADLQVKRQSEEQFTDLSARPEFNPQLYYETYYAQYYYGQQQPQQGYSNHYNAAQGVAAAGAAAAPAVAATTAAVAVGDPDKELAARLMAEDAGYSQVGTFNARTGRFQAKRKGYDDPAGRQIAHYFDEQQWQQQCTLPKKVKLSKKAVKQFKEKKKNKKKVPDYLLGD